MIFKNYPPLKTPNLLIGHDPDLGFERGYRRLEDNEIIQEGDETFGVWGNPWTPANDYQIGQPAKSVGGFFIWRRKIT